MLNLALNSLLPKPQFAYIAPTYSAAKRIVWTYLHQFLEKVPGVLFNEADLTAILPHNKAKIMLLSGENYNSIRGIYLDYCVMDEVADMSPLVWQEAVRPTLSDRGGGCLFLGTPRGNNHFKEWFDYASSGKNTEWYGKMYKASETKIIPDKELASAQATMDDATYQQEYECSFSAGIVGAYFAKMMEEARTQGRLTTVPYQREFPVITGWDLGVSDSTTVWFAQQLPGKLHVIDYYETSGSDIATIVADLQKKGYVYDYHLLPHDAKARDLSTGKSIEQLLYTLGVRNVRVVPRVGQKRDSINAARLLLPRCTFDEKNCARGLLALTNYKRKWDDKTQSFADNPLHDWSSNGADAFQQLAMGLRAPSTSPYRYGGDTAMNGGYGGGNVDLRAETDYNPFSI
ncbi:MAG: hypothetical protein IPL34_20500 [Thiofilum sp.]|uniref:hypothetical protein n=1 Tax=Thiofilum sp. TaxID=2212733 RepID=UPI0025CD5A17|nr:hypothetical protein [Thiofilum sp.]MBK8455664.1 hypothetical protein [Thiofilum sp.]